MLQHDNARPHVERICTQFLEAENIPVLAWPAYSPDMSPIEHVWDALDRRIRQLVPVPANIQQLHIAIEEEWTNIQQATINNLVNSMRRRCVALREANGGYTRYWLVFRPPWTPPQYSKTAHFRVAFYCGQPKAHTYAIIMLSNQHLDMPYLWGGWIISVKEKCSLTQIYTDLWTIFERNMPFVYIDKVLDLWVQLMKNGGKNKSVEFIILFSIYIYNLFKYLKLYS